MGKARPELVLDLVPRAARARARKESELEAAGLYTNGMAARRLGLADSCALTSRLRELRVIARRYTDWALLPPHEGCGYTETVTVMIGRERDTPFQTMAWTKAGLRFLRRLLADPPTV